MAELGRKSNINEMMTTITGAGIAFANRYEVIILSAATMAFASMRDLTLRCDSIVIPGRSLNTVPYRIYGPARNMPIEAVYSGELNMSFILSADLRERNAFEMWLNTINNPSDYKFNYYNNYTALMQINLLDRNDTVVYTAMVEETYPKSIGDLQVGYDRNDEFLRMDVTMSFRKYLPTYFPLPNILSSPLGSLGSLGTLKGP